MFGKLFGIFLLPFFPFTFSRSDWKRKLHWMELKVERWNERNKNNKITQPLEHALTRTDEYGADNAVEHHANGKWNSLIYFDPIGINWTSADRTIQRWPLEHLDYHIFIFSRRRRRRLRAGPGMRTLFLFSSKTKIRFSFWIRCFRIRISLRCSRLVVGAVIWFTVWSKTCPRYGCWSLSAWSESRY